MSSQHITQCLQALNVVYDQPNIDAETRAQATTYLTNLQSQPLIWEVANQLLSMDNFSQHYYFYAANALLLRLQKNFNELPTTEVRLQFRQSLMNHLSRFTDPAAVSPLLARGAPVLIERLCFCLAATAAQMVASGEWSNALSDLTGMLGVPSTMYLLLCVMEYFPEMTVPHKAHIQRDEVGVRALNQHIYSFQIPLLDLLVSALSGDASLHKRALSTGCSWASHRCFKLEEIHTHTFFQALLAAAAMPVLAVTACQTLSSLLSSFSSSRMVDDVETKALADSLGRRSLSLVPLLPTFAAAGNTDAVRELSNVLVDLASAFLPFVVKVSQKDYINATTVATVQDDVGMAVVEAVVFLMEGVVSSGVYEFGEVIVASLRMWYDIDSELKHTLGRIHDELSDIRSARHARGELAARDLEAAEAAVYKRRDAVHRRLQELSPLFVRALHALVKSLELPSDFGGMDDDEKDECKQRRHRIDECVEDLTSLLGLANTFSIVLATTQQHQQVYSTLPSQWQALESAVHTLRLLGPIVCDDSYVDPYERPYTAINEPVFASLQLLLAVLPQSNSYLRYTALLTVGQFASLLPQFPQLIPAVLENTVSSLSDPITAPGAARAFRHVCVGCNEIIARDFFSNVLSVYDGIHSLTKEEQCNATEAITSLLHLLPLPAFTEALNRLINPIVVIMETAVREGPDSPSCVPLHIYLERVIIIIEKTRIERGERGDFVLGSLISMVERISPLILSLIHMFGGEDIRVDRACQAWKYILKKAGRRAQQLVPSVCSAICDAFQKTNQSVFVYVASIIISIFPPFAHHEQLCFNAETTARGLWDFFAPRVLTICGAHTTPGEALPELSEDICGLMIVMADHAAFILADSPHIHAIFPLLLTFTSTTHGNVYLSCTDALSIIIGLLCSRWSEFVNSPLLTLFIEQHGTILHTLIKHLDSNRRVEPTTSCASLIVDILRFSDRVRGANINVPSSVELLHSCLSQPELNMVNNITKKEFVSIFEEAKEKNTTGMLSYGKQVIRDVVKQLKGDRQKD